MKTSVLSTLFILLSYLSSMAQSTLYITANGITHTASLIQNEATIDLLNLLSDGPLTISMTDNGGFEKIGDLPRTLNHNDSQQSAQVGDIMLYLGRTICFFYGSNSWQYTKLGQFDSMSAESLKQFLSGNPVNVTLSLDNPAGVSDLINDKKDITKVYNLNGEIVETDPLPPGIYIINGTKKLIH